MPTPLLLACDDLEALAAAPRSEAEALVFDLGDADAPGDRAARRRAVLSALRERNGGSIDGTRSGATPAASPPVERYRGQMSRWTAPRGSPLPCGEGLEVRVHGASGDVDPAKHNAVVTFIDPHPSPLSTGERGGGPKREGSRAGVSIGPALMFIRVAPLASGLVDGDLDAVMAGAPDAVLLPGASGARDLQHLAAKLAVREAEHGLPAGRTGILAMPADTAAGVLALASLPGATPRLFALCWDPAALAAALGVGVDAAPVRAARDLLLIAAAAAGVPALDRGLAGDDLATACVAARRDGFSGRFARHPREVAIIAAAFSPRPT